MTDLNTETEEEYFFSILIYVSDVPDLWPT